MLDELKLSDKLKQQIDSLHTELDARQDTIEKLHYQMKMKDLQVKKWQQQSSNYKNELLLTKNTLQKQSKYFSEMERQIAFKEEQIKQLKDLFKLNEVSRKNFSESLQIEKAKNESYLNSNI